MMANRKKSYESPQERSACKSTWRYGEEVTFSSSSSSDETEKACSIRNSGNTSQELFNRNRVDTDHQTGQDISRRDENPFSFKHFLKNDTQTNYYSTGARPKVYSSTATSPNNLETDTGVYSRNPTELPDFVQDHLVIEQCYLNHESSQQGICDIDNLPDFALNSVEQRQTRLRSNVCDDSFDFGIFDKGLSHREHSISNASSSAQMDMPDFDRPVAEPIERLETTGYPFDLPLPLNEPDPNVNNVTRDSSQIGESDVPKSLPDFLNDGPIHNRTNLSTEVPTSNVAESTERRLWLENERLRQELDMARRQINKRTKRIQLLETMLASQKKVEHEETAHLEKAMEQVEDNLKRSTRRAVNAESTVTSLKKEIQTLSTEISLLRLENKELRSGIAAAGRSDYGVSSANLDQTVRRLACDLRTAASTAEVSLRQLMSGVDNLRVLASALENVDRIEDRTKDFLPDFDDDNAAGPAL